MHQNLLLDVIQRQAGSLEKAILEGVMNLIEAGATKGSIMLTRKRLIIEDDGRGFADRDDVLESFEVFGKSDERKRKQTVYAQYQMGRGQLLAFGKTTYRSNNFEMTVDIRSNPQDLSYTLRETPDKLPGCKITVDLYDEIAQEEYRFFPSKIRDAIAYVPVPITFNGFAITEPPEQAYWNKVTDEAYFRIGSSELAVYNLGVHVRDFPNSKFGFGGTIVSKKRLSLNFARNEILSDCAVWRAITQELQKDAQAIISKNKTPNDSELIALVDRLFFKTIKIKNCLDIQILKDTNGRKLTLRHLIDNDVRVFSFDARGSFKADKIMQSRNDVVIFDWDHFHFCFSEYYGSKGEYAPHETFLKILAPLAKEGFSLTYQEIDLLYGSQTEGYRILDPSEYKNKENALLNTLNKVNDTFAASIGQLPRRLLLGVSNTAEAWTDGLSFIGLERTVATKLSRTVEGWGKLILLLCHEYAHEEGRTDCHDEMFYERFHEFSMTSILLQNKLLLHYLKFLAKENKEVARKILKGAKFDYEEEVCKTHNRKPPHLDGPNLSGVKMQSKHAPGIYFRKLQPLGDIDLLLSTFWLEPHFAGYHLFEEKLIDLSDPDFRQPPIVIAECTVQDEKKWMCQIIPDDVGFRKARRIVENGIAWAKFFGFRYVPFSRRDVQTVWMYNSALIARHYDPENEHAGDHGRIYDFMRKAETVQRTLDVAGTKGENTVTTCANEIRYYLKFLQSRYEITQRAAWEILFYDLGVKNFWTDLRKPLTENNRLASYWSGYQVLDIEKYRRNELRPFFWRPQFEFWR